jgi:hypothetical protein
VLRVRATIIAPRGKTMIRCALNHRAKRAKGIVTKVAPSPKVSVPLMAWAEFCRQAHANPLPSAVLGEANWMEAERMYDISKRMRRRRS